MVVSASAVAPGIPTFARYGLAGLGSLAVDFLVFVLLTGVAGTNPLVAHLVSRPLGGLTCFHLNRRWTFASSGPFLGDLGRFACVFGASLGLTEALLALFWAGVGLPAVVAKGLAEGIAVVFNFLALSRWAFRPGGTA